VRFCSLNVEKSDAAAGDAAARENGVEHPGRMVIGGVPGRARHFQESILAGQGLSDVRAVPDMNGRRGEGDLRHGWRLRP
jgi:hypothetical protein